MINSSDEERFERTVRGSTRTVGTGLGCFFVAQAVFAVAGFGVLGLLAYVAYHFIQKHW